MCARSGGVILNFITTSLWRFFAAPSQETLSPAHGEQPVDDNPILAASSSSTTAMGRFPKIPALFTTKRLGHGVLKKMTTGVN